MSEEKLVALYSKPIPVAIQRLIEEVQAGATLYCGTKGGGKSYNRVYHRHNRS